MILPGQVLLTRYSFQHWIHANGPLHLLEAMFVKYTAIGNREGNENKGDDEDDDEDLIPNKQVAIWQSIIDKKRADAAKHRAIRPISILRRHVNCSHIATVPRLQTPQQRKVQKKRKTAQKVHRKAVQRGDAAPL
jgi:hypothetical protein